MRYLIIDITELDGHDIRLTSSTGKEMILSPEESLAKFEEIWQDGKRFGRLEEGLVWEDYKKKL